MAHNGGATNALVSGPFQSNIRNLAVDDTSVYWADTSGVMKVPLGGGTVTKLATTQGDPKGIAVDATSVYFTTGPLGTVIRLTPKY